MLKAISISHIWVLDQDEALDFYVGKLGLEKRSDIPLGFMRWLTVGVPGEPGREILLVPPDRLDQLLTATHDRLVTTAPVALRHERDQPMLLRREWHLLTPRGVLAQQTLFERVVQPARAAHVDVCQGSG